MSPSEYYPKDHKDAVEVILTDSLPPVSDYRGKAQHNIAEIVLGDLIAAGYEIGKDIDGPLMDYYEQHLAENGYVWDPTPPGLVDQSAE